MGALAALIPAIVGNLPTIYGVVTAVEKLFGRGKGAEKKAAAADLAVRKGVNPDGLGEVIDLIVQLLNNVGWEGRPAVSGAELQPGKDYLVSLTVTEWTGGEMKATLRLDSNQ